MTTRASLSSILGVHKETVLIGHAMWHVES